MKIKEGYLLREVAGNYVVVPTGKAAIDFNGMMTLNETGAFLWKHLANSKIDEELLSVMLEEYNIDEITAKADISDFIGKLKAADLLE